ncbi:hypothetical protein GIB67_006203 [Kingdonia uniflora]|uniref:Uncharacterized protein n=1 Tax=Kingdonia uniflora TaxID=39325 RepID=A0A7J7LTC0_9MAGN|nr:hypothetical protein GIB67_006203 [Kingdonia uniflora]
MEGKQKATEEKQNKKDEMIRNVNVYRNDDEVDEAGIKISKKRKGPMDALVAPIDVDFFPRAPTSNENKKALENIHGYIADFFYEYNISFNCARSDSYSKMMQAIVQYNDPSYESQILRDLIVNRTKAGRLGKRVAQACVKTIAPDSFDGDDYDVDANYDVGDGDDDGIDSGSDKDI